MGEWTLGGSLDRPRTETVEAGLPVVGRRRIEVVIVGVAVVVAVLVALLVWNVRSTAPAGVVTNVEEQARLQQERALLFDHGRAGGAPFDRVDTLVGRGGSEVVSNRQEEVLLRGERGMTGAGR